MISGSNDNTLRIWNISSYQCDTIINNVKCCNNNSLVELAANKVIVGGLNVIIIVNMINI